MDDYLMSYESEDFRVYSASNAPLGYCIQDLSNVLAVTAIKNGVQTAHCVLPGQQLCLPADAAFTVTAFPHTFLTGILTVNNVSYADVYVKIYPLELQTLLGNAWGRFQVHAWESVLAHSEGASELPEYPKTILLEGVEFLTSMVAIGQMCAAITWGNTPEQQAGQIEGAILTVLENKAIEKIAGLMRPL